MPQRELAFKKTGREIKQAAQQRCKDLQQRLEARNATLEKFLDNRSMVRSFLIRTSAPIRRTQANLFSQEDISSEQMEEIRRVCQRIFELEEELKRLQLLLSHLEEDRTFDLSFSDLIAYGFQPTAQPSS